MGKVSVQKGKIDANPSTMKHMPQAEKNSNDNKMHKERLDGQSCKLHTPKR